MFDNRLTQFIKLMETVKQEANKGGFKSKGKDIEDSDDDLLEVKKKTTAQDARKPKKRIRLDPTVIDKAEREQLLLEILMGMEMDKINEVTTFEEIGMADPFITGKSIVRAMNQIKRYAFDSDIYPKVITEKMVKLFIQSGVLKPPKAMFKPSKNILRKMIRACAKFSVKDNESKFFLRFALLESNSKFMKEKDPWEKNFHP